MHAEGRSGKRTWSIVAIGLGVVVIAVVAVVLRHRSTGEAGPGPIDPALALQVRGVRSIVTTSSPNYTTTPVTCGADRPCTIDDLPTTSDTVLADDTGVKYRMGPAIVTGADVASAKARPENAETSAWKVDLQLTNPARIRFAEATQRLAEVLPPRQIAMIVDGRLSQALTVQSPIPSGSIQIGNLTEEQAKSLAKELGSTGRA